MKLFTIGFTQKSAMQFFELIRQNRIDILVDIRLNNKSQLAGFTKGEDLCYFLREICNCKYAHAIDFAPTKEILDDYKKGGGDWEEYVSRYIPLMQQRKASKLFMKQFGEFERVCLLCSEPTPEKCHRRLLAEMIASEYEDIEIIHI